MVDGTNNINNIRDDLHEVDLHGEDSWTENPLIVVNALKSGDEEVCTQLLNIE